MEGLENKHEILHYLLPALQATRQFYDLVDLAYLPDEELVRATFANGSNKYANVALDSGIAMIKDVIKQIL